VKGGWNSLKSDGPSNPALGNERGVFYLPLSRRHRVRPGAGRVAGSVLSALPFENRAGTLADTGWTLLAGNAVGSTLASSSRAHSSIAERESSKLVIRVQSPLGAPDFILGKEIFAATSHRIRPSMGCTGVRQGLQNPALASSILPPHAIAAHQFRFLQDQDLTAEAKVVEAPACQAGRNGCDSRRRCQNDVVTYAARQAETFGGRNAKNQGVQSPVVQLVARQALTLEICVRIAVGEPGKRSSSVNGCTAG
jgi:hypothetical protein